jgi:ABC-type multidrug transport system permease subunit
MKQKQIEAKLIKAGLKIAQLGKGALFVVTDFQFSNRQKLYVKGRFKPFSIFDKNAIKKLVDLGITTDGAIIVSSNWLVREIGIMIDSRKTFSQHGTRHSAGFSISQKPNTLVILVSEEERKVKMIKSGKILLQLDALEKGIEKRTVKIVNIYESLGVGAASTIGLSALSIITGIVLLPGVVVFAGATTVHYISKLLKINHEQK